MSYHMGVWYEPTPISDIAAERFYEVLCEGQSSRPAASDKIDEFYRELTARYPENDSSPWTTGISVSPHGVVLSFRSSSSKDVKPYIIELAAKHGLFAYNPQTNEMHQGVGWEPTLSVYEGHTYEFPTAAKIAQELAELSAERWFLILEARSHWFIQVAVREDGGYSLEHREGRSDRHFGTTAADLDEVHAAFMAFAGQDDSWKDRFSWERVSFPTE